MYDPLNVLLREYDLHCSHRALNINLIVYSLGMGS